MPDKPAPERVEKKPEMPIPEAPRPIEVPEKAPEKPIVQEPKEPVSPVESPAPTAPIEPPTSVKIKKDKVTQEIETVLSEDLTDEFLKLDSSKQKEFKEKGEETASKIRVIVQKATINFKDIFNLIKDWMKILPGVNKFFLEQEAKIKTDRIVTLAEEEKRRGQDQIT